VFPQLVAQVSEAPSAHRRADRIHDISPFRVLQISNAARALLQQHHDVIRMEIGEPDFQAPEPVMAAAQAALRGGHLGYTPALGIAELREAIARFYASQFGIAIAPHRIVVTAGSSAALLLVCALLLGPGDEVLVTDPGYPCNRQFIRTMEARAVGVPVGPATNYQLTPELVEQHWTPHTRAALLASPSNPTGALMARSELKRLADCVRARGGALIVDEIYQGLVYDEPASTALSLANDVFVVNSFSKYFGMTGWRLGWTVVPEGAQHDIERLAQHLFICPPSLSQQAALACFRSDTLDILEGRRREFAARRDFLVTALRSLGFRIPVMPGGGFYVYADCGQFSPDSEALCRDLLERAHVALTPGVDFGMHRGREHVRFAYAAPVHRLEQAVSRIEHALQTTRPVRAMAAG